MVKKKFGNPGATFSEKVLRIALAIPRGRVTTYGRISRAAGGGDISAQSITSILGKAYDRGQKDIPFHRIVYADGRVWIDDAHRKDRMRKYKEEGIEIDAKGRIKDFEKKIIHDLRPSSKA
jgi:methylated-DNA-protein-cysteine methyltransferase-like protein